MIQKILFALLLALPTVGVASRSLLEDKRVEVTGPLQPMHRVVGYIEGDIAGREGRVSSCTGVAIGPHHILTAAHCLYDRQGIQLENIHFIPGTRGVNDIPFGRFPIRSYYRPRAYLPGGVASIRTAALDMAVAYVGVNMNTFVDLRSEVGTADLWASDDMPFDRMTMIGYPAGYPTDLDRRVPYLSENCRVEAPAPLALATNCYIGVGQSGSPVFFPDTGGVVPAVGGVISAANFREGYISRITPERLQIIRSIKADNFAADRSRFAEEWRQVSAKYEPRVHVFIRNNCSVDVLAAISTFEDEETQRGLGDGFFRIRPNQLFVIGKTEYVAYHLHVHDTNGRIRIGSRLNRPLSVNGQRVGFDRFEVTRWGDRYHTLCP